RMKKDVLLINTARGEIINESDLVGFLKNNPEARAGVDVLADEIKNRLNSPLLDYAKSGRQVVITQHIGGMTREAQEIAYGHAARMLHSFLRGSANPV
ncbi:MAG TPA: NAD(P)-dependent oxidoreductase, partial [Leptospiraceae bacterium]|nr:NAD(P)-dependent oxidoreductase [Leptospiraceae bacterium]